LARIIEKAHAGGDFIGGCAFLNHDVAPQAAAGRSMELERSDSNGHHENLLVDETRDFLRAEAWAYQLKTRIEQTGRNQVALGFVSRLRRPHPAEDFSGSTPDLLDPTECRSEVITGIP
jgi:hypothetical protein